MHITDWLEMLGEHFPLVVIGCAEALLAVVLLCAALRNRRQCADKKRSALRRAVICTPFTGHPVEGVLLCGTHMSTKGNV